MTATEMQSLINQLCRFYHHRDELLAMFRMTLVSKQGVIQVMHLSDVPFQVFAQDLIPNYHAEKCQCTWTPPRGTLFTPPATPLKSRLVQRSPDL